MLIYCVRCKKKTGTYSTHQVHTRNNRLQIAGKCELCNSNKRQFVSPRAWNKNAKRSRDDDIMEDIGPASSNRTYVNVKRRKGAGFTKRRGGSIQYI